MNNFIENVSRSDISTGFHADAGENSMLIQIVDFFDTFPIPKYNFKKTIQFKFDDIEDEGLQVAQMNKPKRLHKPWFVQKNNI